MDTRVSVVLSPWMRIQWPISEIKARSTVDKLIMHTTTSYEIPKGLFRMLAR